MRIVKGMLVAVLPLMLAVPTMAAKTEAISTVKSVPKSKWATVVNKNDAMPNSMTGRKYNSFNQPSVNANAVVVFRARSRGGPPEGPPTRGIYIRDMGAKNGPIVTIAGGDTGVPQPNNIFYPPDDKATSFIEFPSIPRIGIKSNAIATRGNHQPVYAYAETRVGTSGIYVNLDSTDPQSDLLTGASKLGGIDPFPFFAVPGLVSPTAFDVFPGAPAITDEHIIAFKGNFPEGQTGVFYRALSDEEAGGYGNYVELIANTETVIPNGDGCLGGNNSKFGSTAPPSAAIDYKGINQVVFVGLDNEQQPSCGGIYRSPALPGENLITLVGLDSDVPDEPSGTVFKRLGEGLSYDGRFVAFWGAWGEATKTLRLYCPLEGNSARRDYCNHRGEFAPGTGNYAGDPNSVCDDDTDDDNRCYQEMEIPLKQGVFVHDTRSGKTYAIKKASTDFDDFVYWVYSGRVPGVGGEGDEGEGEVDGEFARWRSSAFVAVSGRGAAMWVAFKARTGDISQGNNTYESAVDGIYLVKKPGAAAMETLVETMMPAQFLDPESSSASVITAVGIERDSFRGSWLVINASMEEIGGEEEAGMAGIYLTQLPGNGQ